MAEGKYPNYKRCMRSPGELMIGRKIWNNATVKQWVVPYNQFLSHKYTCHINVEFCATTKAVQYIYKYVCKGADMTMVTIQGETNGQSLLQYLLARYISPVEACMRLFKHPTQGSTHKVMKLAIHLPGQSSATYRANANNAQIRRIIRRGHQTTLTSFFMLCLVELEVAGKMLYKDIPTVYRWDKKSKWWLQYQKYVPSIGRVVHVSPQDPERFYLRLLLRYRRGPTSFEDLRTIDNVMYPTFHEAAMAAGYLENDREWEECLLEASYERMPYLLRQRFGTILVYSLPDSPLGLWERFKSDLSEDFQRELGMDADDRKVEFKTLKSLDNILRVNGKTLENYGLPVLEEYREEADANEQDTETEKTKSSTHIHWNSGTGKSFLLEPLLAKVRLEGGVAIAVASSGIAATLLTGGRTAHSMFRIPLKPNEHSTYGISKQIQKANLIR
ncbi:Helitron helicase [Phytophthora megakarya]|uniref:ATP-dependent DNA helicase n=1 Tax=Phytophthora megakarya TaxID=4795 RepID=A0A225W552_9STRA|nr:Helitron helicase [Phytophthora megakarya]